MTAFTRLGSALWDWAPWNELPLSPRMLWLALYTSGAAKRLAPGLWQGGIPSMAEAAHMPGDEVVAALDMLLERDLVEYDTKYRVLRLCSLPDAGEYPSNGKVILGWWSRFRSVPECGVRDSHVTTLRWILDTGAKESGRGLSAHHEEAWRETFGRVAIPAPRRRGIRRLAESDTGTSVQPSLFGMPSGSGNGIGNRFAGDSGHRDNMARSASVDNSDSLRQMNKNNPLETISDTVSDTNRIPDPRSQIPESYSSEGGRGGGHETGRPSLALVPLYTVPEVIAAMEPVGWDPQFDKQLQDALELRVGVWIGQGLSLDDFRVLAQFRAVSGRILSARDLVTLDIAAHVRTARETISKLEMLREFKSAPGWPGR